MMVKSEFVCRTTVPDIIADQSLSCYMSSSLARLWLVLVARCWRVTCTELQNEYKHLNQWAFV